MNVDGNCIVLEGDVSIETVSAVAPILEDTLREMHRRGIAGGAPGIDLAKVAQIDLCGWQLLALWFRHLRSSGFNPVLMNATGRHRQQLECLGLLQAFSGSVFVEGTEG